MKERGCGFVPGTTRQLRTGERRLTAQKAETRDVRELPGAREWKSRGLGKTPVVRISLWDQDAVNPGTALS